MEALAQVMTVDQERGVMGQCDEGIDEMAVKMRIHLEAKGGQGVAVAPSDPSEECARPDGRCGDGGGPGQTFAWPR